MVEAAAVRLTVNFLSQPDKNYQKLEFRGDLDKYGLAIVREKIEKLSYNFNEQYLVFDFEFLNFINSESIGFLLTVHSHLVKNNKSLIIIHAPNQVRDVLSVIGVLKIIQYFDTVADFEQSLNR